jgi:hypothetical protein
MKRFVFAIVSEYGHYSDYTCSVIGIYPRLSKAKKKYMELYNDMDEDDKYDTWGDELPQDVTTTCNTMYIRKIKLGRLVNKTDCYYMLLDGEFVKYRINGEKNNPYLQCSLDEFKNKSCSSSSQYIYEKDCTHIHK